MQRRPEARHTQACTHLDVVLDEVDHLYARDDTVTVLVDSMKATEQRFGLGRLVAGGLEFCLDVLEVDIRTCLSDIP